MLERALKQNQSLDFTKLGGKMRELIEELRKVRRFDVAGVDNGEFIEIEEFEDEQGRHVNWEDIENVLKKFDKS